MTRPCFLILDREHAGNISTRKLVLETAKLNVITAYTGKEALDTLARFPNVDGLVLDAGVHDIPCTELVAEMKKIQHSLPVVVIGTPRHQDCAGADHFLDTFDPVRLLTLLGSLNPRVVAAKERDEQQQHEGS